MKKGMMISCRDATELVIRKKQESLGFTDKLRLMFHLAMCRFCSLFEKQNKVIDDLAHEMDKHTLDTIPAKDRDKMLSDIMD